MKIWLDSIVNNQQLSLQYIHRLIPAPLLETSRVHRDFRETFLVYEIVPKMLHAYAIYHIESMFA
jgi:hypothetical protein